MDPGDARLFRNGYVGRRHAPLPGADKLPQPLVLLDERPAISAKQEQMVQW